jgi:hypothetical protein
MSSAMIHGLARDSEYLADVIARQAHEVRRGGGRLPASERTRIAS